MRKVGQAVMTNGTTQQQANGSVAGKRGRARRTMCVRGAGRMSACVRSVCGTAAWRRLPASRPDAQTPRRGRRYLGRRSVYDEAAEWLGTRPAVWSRHARHCKNRSTRRYAASTRQQQVLRPYSRRTCVHAFVEVVYDATFATAVAPDLKSCAMPLSVRTGALGGTHEPDKANYSPTRRRALPHDAEPSFVPRYD